MTAATPAALLDTTPAEPCDVSLLGVLDHSLRAYASRPCVDFLGRRWTYGEIGALIDRAAKGFQAMGVKKGVKVGLCLPNTHYYIISYFGVLKAGGTVVNMNPLYVEREMKHLIADSGASIVVTLDLKVMFDKLSPLVGTASLQRIIVCPMTKALPALTGLLFRLFKGKEVAAVPGDARFSWFDDLVGNDGRFAPVDIDPMNDVAVLQYTGGTTGVPKGAMLTHANLAANTHQCFLLIPEDVRVDPKMLGVLPLFHVFAMTVVMNLGLRLGAELILLPRFELKQVMKVIGKKKPTLFPGVPTIYTAINGVADKGHYDLNSIRFCISGGAPLPVEVKTRFEQLTGCKLVEGYGLSEASPVVTCNPPCGKVKPGSIGLPLPWTTVEVRSPDTGEAMPQGERGEICVRGPQVMSGYWNRPDETAKVFLDGALRTGDIGYRDEDGYIFLVDRIKDIIICSGFNVYPRVIEDALYQHPAVAEAVVIGVPDEYRGQAPKAFVKLRPGASANPEELKTFLQEYISKIEMPRAVEIREELPKTMIGKLSKRELVAEEAAKSGQGG